MGAVLNHQTTSQKRDPAATGKASQDSVRRSAVPGVDVVQRHQGQCACGGGCPRCNTATAKNTRNHTEEFRAHGAVARMATSPEAVDELTRKLDDRRSDRTVGSDVRDTLQPYTGPLPSDLRLRTGADVDRTLTARGARGLARGNEVWVGGPQLTPSPGDFAGVFAHEAAHVASGGSRAIHPPYFGAEDSLPGSWHDAERRRHAELEAAETGEGRQRILDRLPAMTAAEVRRDAPGIAYRAQDRGDIELATAAAQRLLDVWLAGSDRPTTFSPFSLSEDSVDILLTHIERAFGAGHWSLGGAYLSIVMVQLVRAAAATVSRRTPAGGTGEPGSDLAASMFLPMQQSEENDIRIRVERARALIETNGATVIARGDAAEIAQFEAMVEAAHGAEVSAGPAIAGDLGTGGAVEEPPVSTDRRGRPRRSETPPARPADTVAAPLPRAAERVVESTHPELERALVVLSTGAPRVYGNIASPRYAIAGTFAGAHRLANELFGQRSSVIVEDVFHRTADGRREIRYLALALNLRLNPPTAPVEEGQLVGVAGFEMANPVSTDYFYLAITSGPWRFFSPAVTDYLQGVITSETDVSTTPLNAPDRVAAVFGPIDALIAAGEIQQAANQLTYVGAGGFALVDTETKIRYITTLLRAFTFAPNERTVVEVFRAIADEAELSTILAGLNREGVLRQLRVDLEYSFTTLLSVVGEKFGAGLVSLTEVNSLLSEIAILQVFPGIELRGDGSFAVNMDLAGNLRSALEELINTIRGLIEGIAGIVMDPEAFFRGIGQLLYLGMMMELARYHYPPAVEYVNNFVTSVARELGRTTHGLAVLQRNMPAGVEFVRDMQTSFQWRVIWEVLGLFVGVGEAVALFEAIRGGRAAAAMTELLSRLRGVGALEEVGTAGRLIEGAGDTGRVLEGAGDVGRTTERVGDTVRTTETLADTAADTERAAAHADAPVVIEGAGDTVGDTRRATDAVGDGERTVASVSDEAAGPAAHADDTPAAVDDAARATETVANAERAADTAADTERTVASATGGGGSRPRGPLPEWQEQYIQDYIDALEEHDLLRASREDVAEVLRAQIRGHADDDVTAIFTQWEGQVDTAEVIASETHRHVRVGEGHMDVPSQDVPVMPRERRIGLPPEGAADAPPMTRVVVGPDDVADFRARHPTLPSDIDTVAVARSNVRGMDGVTLDGGSPRVLREGDMPPAALGPVEAPTTFALQRLHAEQDIANQFIRHVEANGITAAEIEGRTLGIHISNPRGVCHVCQAGLQNPDAPWGVMLQLSERYPGLTIRVTVDGPPGASPAYRALILNSGELLFRL